MAVRSRRSAASRPRSAETAATVRGAAIAPTSAGRGPASSPRASETEQVRRRLRSAPGMLTSLTRSQPWCVYSSTTVIQHSMLARVPSTKPIKRKVPNEMLSA